MSLDQFYPPCNLISDDEFMELHSHLIDVDLESDQIRDLELGIPPQVSSADFIHIDRISKNLLIPLTNMHSAFNQYYNFDANQINILRAGVGPLLRTSIILCHPDILASIKHNRRQGI